MDTAEFPSGDNPPAARADAPAARRRSARNPVNALVDVQPAGATLYTGTRRGYRRCQSWCRQPGTMARFPQPGTAARDPNLLPQPLAATSDRNHY